MKKINILLIILLLFIFTSCKTNRQDDKPNKEDNIEDVTEDPKEDDPDNPSDNPDDPNGNPKVNPSDDPDNPSDDPNSNPTDELDEPTEPEIEETEKIKLNIDINKYLDQTICSIDYLSYDLLIDHVLYGVARSSDRIIVYDNDRFVKTNIYGNEIAINSDGIAIEKGINVDVPEGGMVVSANGEGKEKIALIDIGDLVIYSFNKLFIYKNRTITKSNSIFIKLYEVILSLDDITDIKTYNSYVRILNDLEDSLDSLYNGDEAIFDYILDILSTIPQDNSKNIFYHDHSYNYLGKHYETNNTTITKTNYIHYIDFTNVVYDGGVRARDTMVLYNKDNLVERNSSGFEVALNKDGVVIDLGTLVDLPTDGYILSGHLSANDFLQENISKYDKIVFNDVGFSVYKDFIYASQMSYLDIRNTLINEVNSSEEASIPHDYSYIDSIIQKIDKKLDFIFTDNINLYIVKKMTKTLSELDDLYALLKANIVDNNINKTKGVWYYPFKTFDDTSYDSIKATIKSFKDAGINMLIVSPWYGYYTLLANSTDFLTYPELENYDYNEFGHDYLKCLIELAHNEGISIGIIDGTFSAKILEMKNVDRSLYQRNYSGERAKGNNYYLDICNDKVQDLKYQFYIDVATYYDFDFIEYDIIRYPATNLYSFKGEIKDKTQIIDPGWTEYSINKFKEKYNISGDLKELILTDLDVRAMWLEFKETELINFLTRTKEGIKEVNPNIIISAAVLKKYDNAKKSFLQDYKKWLELGLLDRIEKMNYTESVDEFINNANTYFSEDNIPQINLGIMSESVLTTLYEIDEALRHDGYVLYSSSYYYTNGPLFNDILASTHHSPFISSKTSSEEKVKIIIDELIDMLINYYSIKYDYDFSSTVEALSSYKLAKIKTYINRIEIDGIKNYLLEKLNNLD